MNYCIKKKIVAFTFVLPLMAGILVFTIVPFALNLFYGFTDLGSFGIYNWIGLDNYKKLFADKLFWQTIINTLIYVVAVVPVTIFLSLVLAWLLNKIVFMKNIFRAVYFLPVVTMSAAASLVFGWLFNTKYGLVNSILGMLGVEPVNWLSNGNYARIVIILYIIWQGLGHKIIILLGGLQSISKTYYEAAAIDGASDRKVFFRITLPLLTPSVFYICIIALIGAFQMFDVVYMLIGYKTAAYEKTATIVRYFYDYGFRLGDKGYASAVACVLFVIIMFITLIQFKMQKKWVHY